MPQFRPGEEMYILENVIVLDASPKALKVVHAGKDYWIPKSQVSAASLSGVTGQGMIRMTAWIAKKKGLY